MELSNHSETCILNSFLLAGYTAPLVISHTVAPLQNSGCHRVQTRKSIPVRLLTVPVVSASQLVLILLEKTQTIRGDMLCLRAAQVRTRRRLRICLEEVIEQRLVHAASDIHRLLFAAHGPVECHVGVTADQVDLVVNTICKHRGEAFMSDRDPFGCNDVVQVECTNSHRVCTSSFKSTECRSCRETLLCFPDHLGAKFYHR